MNSPQFLIVRYANGSAGKFLTSLLMSSASVAHFDADIENNKTDDKCLDYIKTHFVKNLDHWLKFEPKHTDAWNLHHISSNYSRGEDLTSAEFLAKSCANATDHFWSSVNKNKCIPLIWHKNTIPEFFKTAKFITIIIDQLSIKWYHRARWYKQYSVVNNKIHLKEHDPAFNTNAVSKYYAQFKNQVDINQSVRSFIKENIIKDPKTKLFQSTDAFIDQSIDQKFINLSDILTVDKCISQLDQICNYYKLTPISENLIRNGHNHWAQCHNFKYGGVL